MKVDGSVIGRLALLAAAATAAAWWPVGYFFRFRENDRFLRTVADMYAYRAASDAYESDHHSQLSLEDCSDGVRFLQPTYVKSVPCQDGWGNRYRVVTKDKIVYLISAGRDGVFEGKIPNQPVHTQCQDADVIAVLSRNSCAFVQSRRYSEICTPNARVEGPPCS